VIYFGHGHDGHASDDPGTLKAMLLADGRIEIDSNVVERAIRPIALNEKRPLRWFRRRRRTLGHRRFADRDLQTRRYRPADLPRRRDRQDRQRPSQQPDRRPLAVGLSCFTRTQTRGLKTPLTAQPAFELEQQRGAALCSYGEAPHRRYKDVPIVLG